MRIPLPRGFREWLRVVPVVPRCLRATLIFGMILGGARLLADREGAGLDFPLLWVVQRGGGIVYLVWIGVAGLARLPGTHPYFNGAYLDWLARMPWSPEKALPNGPVRLVGQDALLVAVVAGLAHWQTGTSPAWVLGAYLGGYLLIAAQASLQLDARGEGYATLFGLAGMVALTPGAESNPIPAGTAAIATLLVAQRGLSRTLRGFPWDRDESARHRRTQSPSRDDAAAGAAYEIGWPLQILRNPSDAEIRPARALDRALIGPLLGSWAFAVLTAFRGGEPTFTVSHAILIQALGLLAALVQWNRHASAAGPPLSLGGRIRTGRLILPHHDRWALGASLTFLTPPVAILGAMAFTNSERVVAAIAVGAVFGVAVNATPPLARWTLTGRLHLRPTSAGTYVPDEGEMEG